jgi:hypothetical protein
MTKKPTLKTNPKPSKTDIKAALAECYGAGDISVGKITGEYPNESKIGKLIDP